MIGNWYISPSTLKNSPYILNAFASILNMEACLCVAYFVSQSGYSKSFEQPCINTSVKRLCMSERCNEKVTCFLMSHASCKSLEFSFPLLLFPFTDFYGRFDSLSPILRDSSCLLWAFSFKFCAVNRRAAGYNWSTRAWPTFDRCVHCIQKISWILLNFFFKNSFSKDNRCMWGQE